jgi:hypothetical protein
MKRPKNTKMYNNLKFIILILLKVLCNPTLAECCLHFITHRFCKDHLMVFWPKHDVKVGFIDNWHTKVVRSALRIGRLYPQEYPGTHFERLSRPRAHGLVGCLGKILSDTTGDLPTSSAAP